ncbi:SMC-Scp complex subunit ScpB [Candidatus Parcubacteria bacterium]|nr:SMC-Scp complex subunit ScpB [Candidatus Parcubacteria bacterium]
MNLEQKIEAILLFKNEPVSYKELAKLLDDSVDNIRRTVRDLQEFHKDRGFVIVDDGGSLSLGTHPNASGLIEKIMKEELSRDLGRAGLETLSIILYKGPVSRREIDYIRGVNSGFILRNLLIRGLIERSDPLSGERSYSYKPTLELLRYLGVKRREDLPEYGTALAKIEDFIKNSPENAD